MTAPGASSIVVCLLGVLLAGALILFAGRESRERAAIGARQRKASTTASKKTAAVLYPTRLPAKSHGLPVASRTTGALSRKAARPGAIFQSSMAEGQFEFLSDAAHQQPSAPALRQKLYSLIDAAAPYTPFHYGVDRPLPRVMQSVLFRQSMSLGIREHRYVTVSNRDPLGTSGRRRGFLWIDLKRGIVLGVIFFHPSNGEPTPTLTIFSRQVQAKSLGMSQLPEAFFQDLNQWSAATGLPPIVTGYFINASGEKIVLTHDENYCWPSAGNVVPPGESCKQMKAQAAAVDRAAAHFLAETHHASNATMHMVAEKVSRTKLVRGFPAQ